ncbi:sigma-70 family RNA polymerase sigma factor [Acidithiobacillus ferrianus]|uniref:Uncharacterized protein n=2 Tax=Acidithiobacillus ferrianus TaxID=2678518 RepID=A0A845U380_9PROT|nr:sigma-70 family RNA polymerase sigma factor [Acidithiobacillus ferrianus]NDU42082.1 hypothetical protein [Acidithiobacillus ferrianus]
MDTAIFWKEAAVFAKKVAGRIKLNGQFVGGDIVTTREDLEQEGLMAAASWLNRHEKDVAADMSGIWGVVYGIIRTAIFSHLKEINRHAGRTFSASDWLENIADDWGDAATGAPSIEPEPEEAAQNLLEEIIENNENAALKESIKCLNKEMQAVVLLHNDGFSFTVVASKMNFSRERPRQLYHKAMRQLMEHVAGGDVAHELPLNYPHDEQETLLYSTQDDKIRELKFRVKSTRGNISRSTRMMRQEGKGGQLSLF